MRTPKKKRDPALVLGTLSMRRSLSGAAQCDIVIAIYRISLSFAGNELGNDPTARKQLRWRRRLNLICTSGQRRTNTLVARTYARWPLRASGVLDELARRVKKNAGPAGQRSMSRPDNDVFPGSLNSNTDIGAIPP